jgi:DNA-binding HxlR family transcriptional regulator
MATTPKPGAGPYEPGSPTRLVIELLANRWTIVVVKTLQPGPLRFTELRAASGLGPQVLTRTLRNLEENGVVTRQVFAEVPPRVEYSLTALGLTMCPVVHTIREWAETHAGDVAAARHRFQRETRKPTRKRPGQ